MLSSRQLIFSTFIFIDALAEGGSINECKITDQECIDANANAVYQQLVAGVPSLGIRPHDPLYYSVIEGDLSVIKYKFINFTLKGFGKCKVSKVKINPRALNLHFEIFCPEAASRGQYEVTGTLIVIPVEGKGDYEIITGDYKLEVDCELNIVDGSDGGKHLRVKNYKIKSTALSPINFAFQNLFNGQKDMSDAVHKFAHDNWKEVADLVQDPLWYAQAKTFFSSANKYLNSVPIDKVLPK